MAASDSFAQNICPDLAAASPAESRAPSRKAFRSMVTFAEMGADFFTCACVFASLLCFPLNENGHRMQWPGLLGMSGSIVAGLLVLFLMRAEGAYRGGGSPLQIRETERVLRISSRLFALPLCFSLLSGTPLFDRLLGLAALLVPLALIVEKQILLATMRVLSRRGYGVERAKMRVARIPDSALPEDEWIEPIEPAALRSLSIDRPAKRNQVQIAKRAVDLLVSALLLLAFAPLLLLIALLIRLDSRGSALFIQKRVGLNGKLFSIYKFRSMYRGVAEYDVSPTSAKDKRITRVGKLLRRTSLDELPQLVNVLLGDMSLVGPRPEMPFIVDRYDVRARQRLTAIPGITGLWQLSVHRPSPIHENIQYDLYYIRNRTFFMDAAILVHTLFFAMRGV